jgi:hypothetical protein
MINITTGRSAPLGIGQNEMQYTQIDGPSGPIVASPSQGSDTDWTFTDLRTMQSVQLSSLVDLSGVEPNLGAVAATSEQGVFAFGLRAPMTEFSEGSLTGDILIFDGALDAYHLIAPPEGVQDIGRLDISPDGTVVAFTSRKQIGLAGSEVIYSLVSLRSGDLLGQSVSTDDPMVEMRWLADSSGIVFVQDKTLQRLSVTPGSKAEVVFSAKDDLYNLSLTPDPDVVVVTRMQAEEVATETPDQIQPMVYIVSLSTGDVTEVEGRDFGRNMSPWPYPVRYLVMTDDPEIQLFTPFSIRIVDAVTGEAIGEHSDLVLSEWAEPRRGLALDGVQGSEDGSTLVISGIGAAHLFVIQAVDGVPTVRQSPGIDERWVEHNWPVTVRLSPDGKELSLVYSNEEAVDESRGRYLLDLTDPNAEWVHVATESAGGGGPGIITFVPGTGD